jgi:hypothetical protein
MKQTLAWHINRGSDGDSYEEGEGDSSKRGKELHVG